MAQSVLLPDGSSVTIRTGETPESAYSRAQQMYPEAFGGGKPPEEAPKSGFMPSLKGAISDIKGAGAALAGRTGLMGLPEAEKAIAEQEAYKKKIYAPTTESWTEAPFTKIGELAGGSVPYMAAPLIAGAAIGSAPVTGALGLGAAGATALGLGAAGLASATQATGSNLQRQMAEGKKLGETDLTNAALASIPIAALDTFSLRMTPGLGKIFERAGIDISAKAAQDLAKEGIKKTAADYFLATGKTMSREGLTEAGQQVFERMQAGLSITDPSARAEYWDNFIGGAVLGGILAPAGRYVERGAEQGRFDKEARAKQIEQQTVASKAAEQAAAAEAVEKQTPEYAAQAAQEYQDAEQAKAALQAQIIKGQKGTPLSEADKQANKDINQQLRELAPDLKEKAAEYNRVKPILFAAKKQQAEEEAQRYAGIEAGAAEAPAATAPYFQEPQATLPGMEAAPVAAPAPTVDTQEQALGFAQKQQELTGLLEDNQGQLSDAAASGDIASHDKLITQRKRLETEQAFVTSKLEEMGGYTAPDQRAGQLDSLIQKSKVALQNMAGPGYDPVKAEKQVAKIKSLEAERSQYGGVQTEIGKEAYRPTGGISEPKAEFAARQYKPGTPDIEAQEQAYREEQAVAEQQAGLETERERTLAPERLALRGMQAKPSPAAIEQFEMFGGDLGKQQLTPSSAPLGQMMQILSSPSYGEDMKALARAQLAAYRKATAEGKTPAQATQEASLLRTPTKDTGFPVSFTAPEEGKREVQRGGPAPFKLLPRQEGTAKPLTRADIEPRINQAMARTDLSDEAYALLNRALQVLPAQDVAITEARGEGDRTDVARTEGFLTLLDRQLTKIERDEEGVARKGAAKPEMLQRFPVTGAAETTVPTAARPTDITKGRGMATPLMGRELQRQRHAKYMEGIEAGLKPAEANRRAYTIKTVTEQPEDLGRARTGAAEVPAFKRAVGIGPETIRAPRSWAVPLSVSADLEPLLRMSERLAQEDAGQQSLFAGEEKKLGAVKPSREAFERLMNSPYVRTMRKDIAEGRTEAKQTLDAVGRAEATVAQLTKKLEQLKAVKNVEAALDKVWDKDFQATERGYDDLVATINKNIVDRITLDGHVAELEVARKKLDTDVRGLGEQIDSDFYADIEAVTDELRAASADRAALDAATNELDLQLQLLRAETALTKLAGAGVDTSEIKAVQKKLTEATNRLAVAQAKRSAPERKAAEERIAEERTTKAVRTMTEKSFRDRLSEEHTRVWNAVHSGMGTPTRVRGLTAMEKAQRGFVTETEIKNGTDYEKAVMKLPLKAILLEMGRVDKSTAAMEKKVAAARKNTGRFVGGEQNVVTFPHMAEGIKVLARNAVEKEALERAYNEKKAVEQPRFSTEAPARKVRDVTSAEQDTMDVALYGMEEAGRLRDQITKLEAQLLKAEKPADIGDLNQRIADTRSARAKMLRRYRAAMAQGRVSAAARKVPSNKIVEERSIAQPTVSKAVAEANAFAEKILATKKPLTAAQRKQLSMAQEAQLFEAAQRNFEYLSTQLNALRDRITGMQRAQAEIKAGRRSVSSFNSSLFNSLKAQERSMEIEYSKARAVVNSIYEKTDSASEMRDDHNSTILPNDAAFAVHEGNILSAVDALAANGSTQLVRELAAKLKPFLDGVKISINPNVKYEGKSVAGLYKGSTNSIEMHPMWLTEEDTIHEMAHAATMVILTKPSSTLTPMQRSAIANLQKVFDKISADETFTGEYALKDLKEFVSEVYSNQMLRNKLDSMGGTVSLWTRVKQFFAQLFNVPMKADPTQSQTLLADIDNIMSLAQVIDEPSVASAKRAAYGSKNALTDLAETAIAQPKTMREKAGSNLGLQFEMQVADMRAGLIKALNNAVEDPKTMGSTKLFRQAIFSVTASDQAGAVTQMSLSNGPPVMFKDDKGYYEVRSTMKNSAADVFDAVQDIPDSYGNTQAKMNMASAYMIAQRALNKGLKKLDLGALGITEEKVVAAMAAADADPKLKTALENTRRKYNAYNKGMIEWLSSPQVGAITSADAKAFLKDEDYVPFYRVLPNGKAELVFGGEKTITIGDIRHQPYLASLEGGENKIMSLDESIMRNTMLLVTKGMTNITAKNVGYAMQAAGENLGPADTKGKPTNLMPINLGTGPDDASVIRWTQEPDPNKPKDKGERWLRVQTNGTLFGGVPAELIVQSLEGAHLTLPAFLKWGGIAGDLLRSGITRTPIYLARQLFRDPFAATATSGLDYNPIKAIFKANKEFLKIVAGTSETGAKMIEKGLLQSGMFEGDAANMSKIALQLASGKSQGMLDRVFAGADRLALQADAATRSLIYDNAIKNGLSEVEASHAVRESMNFSKRGLSPTVQYASRMIPFFNAQIQGLSVLFKAATGNMPNNEVLKIKRKFFNNAMMLTGFGLAYAMAMDDDEYYKNAKPRDRYSNFFMHLPGVDEPIKLPIPYEFGWFFSAGVAMADAIKGEVDTPQQLRALKDMFVGAIPGASSLYVPQIVKPLAEVYANKSFFSGNPLESERLRKLDPEARYNAHTTEVAKWMATMVPGLSPIQIEHIVSGYLGQIPLMIVASTNDLFRESKIEPTRKTSELPLIGSSFQTKYGGEESDVVYKLATEAAQAKRTFDNYRSTGKVEEARSYMQEHRAEIMVAPLALQYQKMMGQLRKQEEVIRSTNASPEVKATRIDNLNKQRQLQSERYLKAIRRAEEVGKTTPR